MQYLLIFIAQVGLLFLLSRSVTRNLSAVSMSIFGSQRLTVWLLALLFWPGTLIHELAHLVVARLLLVRAGHLTIWPRLEGDGIVMGSVLIPQTDRIRRFIIGVAPVLVGLALLFGTFWWAETHGLLSTWTEWLVVGYLVFEVGNTLFASKADMEGALGLFIFLAIIGGLAYWLGWRPSINWIEPYINNNQPILTQAVRWLWLPIVIDIAMLAILWSFTKLLRVAK